MPDTLVERELLPGCKVVAVLERIGQGMERERFIELSLNDCLITWSFNLNLNASVVGHATSLAPLQKRIDAVASRSFSLSSGVPIRRRPLSVSGQASGKVKKQTCSADQFASISLRAEPRPSTNKIQVIIPRSSEIPNELYSAGLPTAILDGVCLAAFGQEPTEPFVGFQVTVLAGKWHDVDSSSSAFKKATSLAMTQILSQQANLR
jgi:hypothetical protein